MTKPIVTDRDTILALLERSRRDHAPIRRSFVQQGGRGEPKSGPLAAFVSKGDIWGLRLYLLFMAAASSEPWDVALSAQVWARALKLGDPALISKIWRRLAERKLITKVRSKRQARIIALCEDGSGEPYSHPGRVKDPYLQLPFEYWTADAGWYRLPMPETAVLLIGLSLAHRGEFILPLEQAESWYGISADTAGRGLQRLHELRVLRRRSEYIKAPLSPQGWKEQRYYTLLAPFAPRAERRAPTRQRNPLALRPSTPGGSGPEAVMREGRR